MPHEPQQRTCVGTGFIVLDVIRTTVENGATEKRFAGGSCGNVLAILSYFGWTASAVGRIGDDHAGRELLHDLGKWGVRTDLLRVEAGRGTPVIVQENYVDSKGRPRHRFSRACPVCGASLPAYRPLLASEAESVSSQLPAHAVFYFDRVAPGTLELAQKSRARGALIVFEPSGIKDERMFAECLSAAHIVKYSNERIEGIHDLVAKAKVPVEIETLGTKGLRLRVRVNGRAGAWKDLPAYPAPEVRDTSGSGDWCTAGIVQRLLGNGSSVEQLVSDADAVIAATRYGQALAALNCGFEGARGLMYAANAKRVLDLAGAIVSGRDAHRELMPSTVKRTTTRRNGSTCVVCSSGLEH
ncbi:MAG TPA: PfkB family carbohydrate kinase [Myxococcaceae bacterium]|jgi:fructokinase